MAEDVYQHDISEEEAPGGRSERRSRSRPEGRKFVRKPKMCAFCVEKSARIDYKQVDVLRRYVTERGKIRPRRQTGMCARHQRRMAMAIKRARHLALLPFTATVSH